MPRRHRHPTSDEKFCVGTRPSTSTFAEVAQYWSQQAEKDGQQWTQVGASGRPVRLHRQDSQQTARSIGAVFTFVLECPAIKDKRKT